MNKKRFIEILLEEGYAEEDAHKISLYKPSDVSFSDLTEEEVRESSRREQKGRREILENLLSPDIKLFSCNLELITIDKIAVKLRVHPETMRRYIRQGKLKAQKIGRTYYVSKDNFMEFVSGGKQ